MFVVGFDYETGMEKALFRIIPYLEIRVSIGEFKSRSGFQCAEFKPPIMGLFLVPYMESMISSWEFTAGIYRRCLISTSGNTFYQHGIVKFCRKNQRFFGGIGALLHTKKFRVPDIGKYPRNHLYISLCPEHEIFSCVIEHQCHERTYTHLPVSIYKQSVSTIHTHKYVFVQSLHMRSFCCSTCIQVSISVMFLASKLG